MKTLVFQPGALTLEQLQAIHTDIVQLQLPDSARSAIRASQAVVQRAADGDAPVYGFAVGETLWSPIVPALINDLAPDRLRGRYNSLQGLVWGVSGALGPGLTALLLGAGLVSLWIGLVVVGCTAAAVMALRLRSHLTPELDGRVPDTVAGGTMTP